jgi:hypothetical protein
MKKLISVILLTFLLVQTAPTLTVASAQEAAKIIQPSQVAEDGQSGFHARNRHRTD